jgi:hypothetical protein
MIRDHQPNYELYRKPRTVCWDLGTLQAAGFLLYADRSDGKNLWSMLETLEHHILIPFTYAELLALDFCHDLLKFLHHSRKSIRSPFEKIKATIPPESKNFSRCFNKVFVCFATM